MPDMCGHIGKNIVGITMECVLDKGHTGNCFGREIQETLQERQDMPQWPDDNYSRSAVNQQTGWPPLVGHPGCTICGPDHMEYGEHTTEQHSEDWVGLADARYTGEVVFMPAGELKYNLEEIVHPTTEDEQWIHVDRRVIQALIDAITDAGIDSDDQAAGIAWLQQRLADHPVRDINDELGN
jgi:hypothetical protein